VRASTFIALLAALLASPLAGVRAAAEAGVEAEGLTPPAEAVVVLHGLGRSNRAMGPLASRLAAAGYAVYNVSYPSTELPPEALDGYLHEQVEACCAQAPRVHFVTHSLGGILVRAHLARHAPANLGRVVMLAPPSQGSEIVDQLGDSALFQWALGPTAAQLGTGPESLPGRLPPPRFEVGVIAGTRSVNPLGSAMVPGPDDGTVAVENTRFEGMTDFVTVPASHTFIMRSDAAADHAIEFLRAGRFSHAPVHSD